MVTSSGRGRSFLSGVLDGFLDCKEWFMFAVDWFVESLALLGRELDDESRENDFLHQKKTYHKIVYQTETLSFITYFSL